MLRSELVASLSRPWEATRGKGSGHGCFGTPSVQAAVPRRMMMAGMAAARMAVCWMGLGVRQRQGVPGVVSRAAMWEAAAAARAKSSAQRSGRAPVKAATPTLVRGRPRSRRCPCRVRGVAPPPLRHHPRPRRLLPRSGLGWWTESRWTESRPRLGSRAASLAAAALET